LSGQHTPEVIHPLATIALLVLPALGVWLTASAVALLPESRFRRFGFWMLTVAGWIALLVLLQGRAESGDAERQLILVALGLVGLVTICSIKARSLPSWRVIVEVVASIALLTLVLASYSWSYDARTRSIVARAETRWTDIGLPMTEFEKTLTPIRENAGSEVLREVLRQQVNTRYYKNGTPAAEREPAIQQSEATTRLLKEVSALLSVRLPPSDDVDLSAQSVAALEKVAATLDADCRRILEVEPATWESDPHDGYLISVPNFLGIRQFAQITAADAMRRFAIRDQDGAARSLAAALRLRKGLVENPTLVSLMIGVAVDALLSSKQVRLPASEDGFTSIARDAAGLHAELLRKLQIEAWVALRMVGHTGRGDVADATVLPKWAARIAKQKWFERQFAIGALNGAEHAAIQTSPATITLPDLGASLHAKVSEAAPSIVEVNWARAILRIHATLLLREQTELIRQTRTHLVTGHPVESRDSVVLPRLRWELTADVEKGTVATRLTGAPEWIAKNEVIGDGFWLLPVDGSVAWQFRLPAHAAVRD
jgi:hypothetical protein